MSTRRLGEFMVARGRLDEVDLERVLKRRRYSHQRIGDLLVQEGLVTEEDVVECLAEQYDLPVWDDVLDVDESSLAELDPETILSRSVLPIRTRDDTLTLAISDALDYELTDSIGRVLGRTPRIVIASESRIREALLRHLYGPSAKSVAKAPGDTKGRFRLDGLVEPMPDGGRYRAFDTLLRRPVTVVVFNSDRPEILETFAEAARLDHVRVPDLLDLRPSIKGGFAVLREVVGHTLRTYSLLGKTWGESEAVDLASSLVATLRTIERQGLACGFVSETTVLVRADSWSLLPMAGPMGPVADVVAIGRLLRAMLSDPRRPDTPRLGLSPRLGSLLQELESPKGGVGDLETLGQRLADVRVGQQYETAASTKLGGADVYELRDLTHRVDTSFLDAITRVFKRAA